SVEPVKVNFRTSGLVVSSFPIFDDCFVVTTLKTPFGIPARCASSASARQQSGVSDGGLIRKVQPEASAGAAFRVIMATGKFHGVTAATTPTGSLKTRIFFPGAKLGITSP